MLKMSKNYVNKNFVKKCIEVALEKAPNNVYVNHTAGMFAERQEYVNMMYFCTNIV